MTTINRLTVPIEGLSCGGGGALAIERAIKALTGVTHVSVNPVTEAAYVEFEPALCNQEQIFKAIERAGFRATEPDRR